MNFLLYIGGWWLGWAFFNGFVMSEKGDNFATMLKVIIWTMLWIWFCWRFI